MVDWALPVFFGRARTGEERSQSICLRRATRLP